MNERIHPVAFSRRELLTRSALSFGMLGLTGTLQAAGMLRT